LRLACKTSKQMRLEKTLPAVNTKPGTGKMAVHKTAIFILAPSLAGGNANAKAKISPCSPCSSEHSPFLEDDPQGCSRGFYLMALILSVSHRMGEGMAIVPHRLTVGWPT
jgi:hypothetical protein